MAEMDVQLVAVERSVWSGRATSVFARTTEGEIGILPNHIPLLGALTDVEVVRIDSVDEGQLYFVVYGGFLSVGKDRVSVLAESVELRDEIDVDAARSDLDSADEHTAKRAKARLRAAGQPA
nr:F0F1 ATP synthase subunit epsilon [Sciscionella marina]